MFTPATNETLLLISQQIDDVYYQMDGIYSGAQNAAYYAQVAAESSEAIESSIDKLVETCYVTLFAIAIVVCVQFGMVLFDRLTRERARTIG